jgi:hypothetical protein
MEISMKAYTTNLKNNITLMLGIIKLTVTPSRALPFLFTYPEISRHNSPA